MRAGFLGDSSLRSCCRCEAFLQAGPGRRRLEQRYCYTRRSFPCAKFSRNYCLHVVFPPSSSLPRSLSVQETHSPRRIFLKLCLHGGRVVLRRHISLENPHAVQPRRVDWNYSECFSHKEGHSIITGFVEDDARQVKHTGPYPESGPGCISPSEIPSRGTHTRP